MDKFHCYLSLLEGIVKAAHSKDFHFGEGGINKTWNLMQIFLMVIVRGLYDLSLDHLGNMCFFQAFCLGGGFKHFLCSPLPGEMIQFDEHIFQMGGSTTN